jgi:hypothetical protein
VKGEIMSYSSPAGAYRIDIADQIGTAFRTALDNLMLVIEMALLPFVAIVGIELAGRLVLGVAPGAILVAFMSSAGLQAIGLTFLVALLIPIAAFLVIAIFIVRWYRFMLLAESVAGGLIPPGWSDFVVASIKLAVLLFAAWIVLVVIALLPPHIITAPLTGIGMIALGFVSVRFSLIFPAAAIEQPLSLQIAWQMLTGNYWRLFLCLLACYLPFIVVEYIVMVIGAVFPSLFWIIFEAARLAVSFAGIAVVGALLSNVYRDIATRAASPPAA